MNEPLYAQRVVSRQWFPASESFNHSHSSQTQDILDTVALHPRSRNAYFNCMGVSQIRSKEYIITAQRVSLSTSSLVIFN